MSKSEARAPSVRLDKSQFNSLVEALNNLTKVFAYAQIRSEPSTERKARFLKVFGLTEQEIADLLGITQPSVNIALSKAKKKGRKSSKGSNDPLSNA